MKFDVDSLNEEQKEALYETEGVVFVVAGAGTGKTRLLTHRIGYLLEQGVPAYNILAITFTNKAANEMKERVEQMTDKHVWISTFHSMCIRILREEIDVLDGYDKNFTIVDDEDKRKIVKTLCKPLQIDDGKVSEYSNLIETIKNKNKENEMDSLLGEMGYEKEEIGVIKNLFDQYENYLRKNNSLDFNDLISKTILLFDEHTEILNKYANRLRYILVDEFQDTSQDQYDLLEKLASVHKNLFVVGDEDQSIYKWRGAKVFIEEKCRDDFLKKGFKVRKPFKLERNYRSTKNILNLANNVISNNKKRVNKNLYTNKENGDGPVVYSAYDETDEARFIAREISNLLFQGYSCADIAVIIRIASLSRPIEEALRAYNIPYKLYAGRSVFESSEIKNLIAYLNIFVNPKDESSLLRVINFPRRKVGEKTVEELKFEAGSRNLLDYLLSEDFKNSKHIGKLYDFVEGIKETKQKFETEKDLSKFVLFVLKRFGILEEYSTKNEESKNKELNISSFVSGIKKFQEENEKATLLDYLSSIMLQTDKDDIQEKGFVSLATIHAVKGLEFRVVFIAGLEKEIFPLDMKKYKGDLDEERRLMYVAITRAKEKIYFTHAERRMLFGKYEDREPSCFLSELNIVDPLRAGGSVGKRKENNAKKDEEFFESGYNVGDRVFLPRFGDGTIVEISDDGLVGKIDFEQVGIKEIMLDSTSLEKWKDE